MSFVIFLKKELYEMLKTAKGIILAAVFFLIGISSPLLAKLTPALLRALDDPELSSLGIDLASMIPDPTSADGYYQFFSNMNSMGLLALIIIFAGIVANEKSKGTAAYILTKNISRGEFIFSKIAAACIFAFGSTIIAAVALRVYTELLFNDKAVSTKYYLLYFAMLLLYIFFILCITTFASIVSKNVTIATCISFLIYIGVNILSEIPKIGKFMPPRINDINIMFHSTTLDNITINIFVTVILCVILLGTSFELFSKQEL